jgi:serine/threonine protein kinase
MALEPEALLNNRYRIVEILGQGGMGSVYRAVDENLGVDVAVKDNFFTTEDYARQFRREATILAGLRHPNLPRVTDHFVIEGQGQYLVMDYIAGEDLRQRMDRLGMLSVEEVVKIGAAICDALDYLAACSPPIVHRDIKPGNVKIDPDGQIFLVDFGLAKILFGSQLTTTGARAMTPGYSPPEQYGSARTDARSDLYSLGATLYAALTGYVPEDALNRAIDQVHLTSIRKLNPLVPRRLAQVIEKSMAIKPDQRYQNPLEFKEALLNSLSSTRRNAENLELLVAPPPEPSSVAAQNGLADGTDLAAYPGDVRSGPPLLPPIENGSVRRPGGRPSSPRSKAFTPLRGVLYFLGIVLIVETLLVINPFIQDLLEGWGLPGQAAEFIGIDATATPSPTLATTIADDMLSLNSTMTAFASEVVANQTPAPPQSATSTLQPSSTPTSTTTPTPTNSPTPKPTQLGGSDGRVAFASLRDKVPQIWVADFPSLQQRQVTNLPEGACQPDWSPDGSWLVFTSPCFRNQEAYPGAGLFLINVDDPEAQPVPLSTVPGGDYDPRWSPDGTMILFTSQRYTGRPRLFTISLPDQTVTLVVETFERDYQPAWSSDGSKIVFVATNKGVNEIWTMNADGTNRQPVTRSNNAVDSSPDWSTDGTTILFTQNEVGFFIPKLMAVIYGAERPDEFQISPVNVPMREARYSPDGLWLIFESWPEGGNHDIYIMTANGSNRQRISDNPLNDFDGAWGILPQP